MTTCIYFRTRAPRSVKALVPALKKAVRAALGTETKGEVNVVLEGESGIRRLNRRFLSRAGATDVLAFNHPKPACPISRGGAFPFGDIYICLSRARDQAKQLGHTLETELLILTIHGALHLAGMDDSTARSRRKMDDRTLRLLRKL